MPDLGVRKKLDFPIDSLACRSEKERRSVKIVETIDQKVGFYLLSYETS